MTDSVWRYLESVLEAEVYSDAKPHAMRDVLNNVWPDAQQTARELAEAYAEVRAAEEEEPARDALVSARKQYPKVHVFLSHLPDMRMVLFAGLSAIGSPAIEYARRWFEQSADLDKKARIVLLLADFGEAAADCVPFLVAELADSSHCDERHAMRFVAAYALGKIGVASANVVELLAERSSDVDEPQSLRSYCIEALLDLGPSAAAAIPFLKSILNNEAENEDLRHFAWAALKSVSHGSSDHPCGGTIAEHMRSLYRTAWESEMDRSEEGSE